MLKFIFHWRITALQYCVGFCHTTTWISIPMSRLSWTSPQPHPAPLDCPRTPGWVSCAVKKLPICCSVTQSWLTPCNPMDCSIPDLPVLQYLLELAQTHIHWVSDAIQPSHPLSPPSPPALKSFPRVFFNEWALHIREPKYWELQRQSFQWIFKVDFL